MSFVTMLFGWMPLGLQAVAAGVVGIFLIWTILKIVAIIMDCIPFL